MVDYGTTFALNTSAIRLGLKHVKYDHEQFPGLVYRLANSPTVFLVFASGKIVITGMQSINEARTSMLIPRILSTVSESHRHLLDVTEVTRNPLDNSSASHLDESSAELRTGSSGVVE